MKTCSNNQCKWVSVARGNVIYLLFYFFFVYNISYYSFTHELRGYTQCVLCKLHGIRLFETMLKTRAVARALIGGLNIHIFVLCPTNFF